MARIVLEVKASEANIDRFMDIYRPTHQARPHAPLEDEYIKGIFKSFNVEVKRGTLKRIEPAAKAKNPHDIFEYYSFEDLEDAIERAAEVQTKAELKRIEKEGATRVFENDRAIIIHPITHEASRHYGAGSQWCTASKDAENFRSYTQEQGVVLLYVLPKGGAFDVPSSYKVADTKEDDATIDYLIGLYPDAFEWSYDSPTKAIGKYIKAAYLNHRQAEPLSIIAGWSPDNAIGVAQTREYMRRVIKNWNLNGSEIVYDIFDEYVDEGREATTEEGITAEAAVEEGLTGFLTAAWLHLTPGSPGAEEPGPVWPLVKRAMTLLHQGGQAIGRAHPIKSRRNDKFAIAVYAMKTEEGGWVDPAEHIDELEQRSGMSHAFGNFAAEAYDAEDSTMGVNQVVKAVGLTNEDITKISEYITKFAGDKVWQDKVPKKIYQYMEQAANQTPENIKRADEFFGSQPFWQSSWDYAWKIRGREQRTKQDGYLQALGDEREQHQSKPWQKLEKAFIDQIDDAAKIGNKVRGYMLKKQDWSGVKELEKEFDMDAGQAVDHVNNMYDEWKGLHQQPVANYLGMASGLLGYLFHVKKYDWPELEKRIVDPEYYHIRTHMLGPDWIQHGRGGDRWEEFENMILNQWMYTTAHPYTNQRQVDLATDPGTSWEGVPRWEREQAKTNIYEHNNLHGDVENIIQLVKHTKRAYGGGTGGSERAAWEEARDAWWNDPDIVALYWGHGAIFKKQTPSQRKRGTAATKYTVKPGKYVKRPFYHAVKPAAWLDKIPNIFTISNSHSDAQYIGQYGDQKGDAEARMLNI